MPAWDDAAAEQLTALWLAVPVLSAAQIGRRMGVSKNAVVSKAARLGLPGRESPILRSPGGGTPAMRSATPVRGRTTLPALAALAEAVAAREDAREVAGDDSRGVASLRRIGNSQQCGVFTRAAARVPRATLDTSVGQAVCGDGPAPKGHAAGTTGMESGPPAAAKGDDGPCPAVAADSGLLHVVAARRGPVAACCWPLGDPGTPGFGFCGAEAQAGRPYCARHCATAYEPVRPRPAQAV